jgi:hypothetical protein
LYDDYILRVSQQDFQEFSRRIEQYKKDMAREALESLTAKPVAVTDISSEIAGYL